MDPDAIYWPVGSNRAAKTSPEWPVNSMTGDCSALARAPYYTSQNHACSSNGQWQQRVRRVTYSLNEGAILGGAVGDGEGGAVGRVRLRALDELAGAKGIVGGAFLSRHGGGLCAGLRVRV
jgi:hypothetical protein